jgi:hypothetical protein
MTFLTLSALASAVLMPALSSAGSDRTEAAQVIQGRPTGDAGEVRLQGEVVEVDRATGRLALTTETGPLVFHVPPRDLAGVRVGDVLEVVLLDAPDHEREEVAAGARRPRPASSIGAAHLL